MLLIVNQHTDPCEYVILQNFKRISALKMAVFWFVALFSLVEVYRRLRVACYLHHQGRDYEGRKHL
jgi:hypothetical protein